MNNYKIKYFIILIILSLIHAQFDYGINYDLKYSNGKGDNTDIFENYIDLNIYYNNLYYYSLIKYKDPALIGAPTKKIDDIYSIFYLEYSNDNFILQVGDIFNSFGSGLSLHTFEDRTIDYNNAPRGASILYYLKDNIELYGLYGNNIFKTRTFPSKLEPDIFIDNELLGVGVNFQSDYFDFHYLNLINNQRLEVNTILYMKSLNNELGDYLDHRYANIDPNDFNMSVLEHNFGANFYLGNLELYFEKSWVYHNKIEGERILGYRYYFSSYLSINDYAILYEYKNYNTPYYFSVYSNPPTVFQQNASTLISRNLHNIDFSNEVGHHILINKSYSEQANIVISSAFAYKHKYDDNGNAIKEPGFGEILDNIIKMNNISKFEDVVPFRQIYFELNGWNKNDNLYYRIGLDNYFEHTIGKEIKAKTLPLQFTVKLPKMNSFSIYFEYQTLDKLLNPISNHEYMYISPSYNHFGKWIVSLFYDYEKENKEGYFGTDITYYLSDNNIISFFLGSQKGGLVCANGTCVIQPDFENGFKITSRLTF